MMSEILRRNALNAPAYRVVDEAIYSRIFLHWRLLHAKQYLQTQ